MTIRLRLALWYVLFLVITVLGFGIGLHFMLVAHVQAEVDRALRARAADEIVRTSRPGTPFTGVRPSLGVTLMPPSNEFREPGVYLQILDSEGVPVIASLNLQGQSLPTTPSSELALRTAAEQIETVHLEGGFRIRLLTTPIIRDGVLLGALQTAQSLQLADSTVDRFRNLVVGGSAGVIVIALLSGAYLARKSLAPVAEMTKTAETITRQGDLSKRISGVDGSDELSTLGRTFNRMLDHIEQGVMAQRRFVADASHELKTPLTAIRGNADLLGRGLGERDTEEAAAAILREATRMQRIVNDLLAIAELDSTPEMQLEPVEINQLMRRVAGDFEPIADGRTLQVNGNGTALVIGDMDKLERALRNLVQNAISATRSDGRIEIGVARHDGEVVINVADDGSGIPPAHLPHVFERFYRVDPARARSGGGTGLGLTIVQSIAEAHGGSVIARNGRSGGAEFEVRLPVAPAPHGDRVPPARPAADPVLRVS